MEDWKKLVLDPAAFPVIEVLETSKDKGEVAEILGLEEQRVQNLLGKLQEAGLVKSSVEKGVRKFSSSIDSGRKNKVLDHLKEEVPDIEDFLEDKNFPEARESLEATDVDEVDPERLRAELEILEKLSVLHVREEEPEEGRRSLKSYVTRFFT